MRAVVVVLLAAVGVSAADPVPEEVRSAAVEHHREQYAGRLRLLAGQVSNKGLDAAGRARAARQLKELRADSQFVPNAAAKPVAGGPKGAKVGWLRVAAPTVKAIETDGIVLSHPEPRGANHLGAGGDQVTATAYLFLPGPPPKGAAVGKPLRLPRVLYWTGERRKFQGGTADVAHVIELTAGELAALPKE